MRNKTTKQNTYGQRLELIDFLKGYSMFTIVIFHYLQVFEMPKKLEQLISFGGTGVHLFILISGFGLYLSHLKNPLSFKFFIRKRFSKIYIPYILIVLLSALISIILPIYYNSLYALLGHVFLFKMFDEAIIGSYGYPLWFISLIFQFYIAFHLLVKFKNRTKDAVFITISLVISLLWILLVLYLGKQDERVWSSFFLQYLWEFALGIVLAKLFYENRIKIQFNKKWYLILIGTISCLIYGLLAIKSNSIGKLVNDIPALIGYTSIAIFIYSLSSSIVTNLFLRIGKYSFSIYLLHKLILLIILQISPISNTIVNVSVSLLVCFILAVFYQQFIGLLYKMLKV